MAATNQPLQTIMATNTLPVEAGQFLHTGLQILLIVVLIIYAIVALMTLKQISLMTRTIKSDTNKYIYLIGYLHLSAVLLCLLFAVISL